MVWHGPPPKTNAERFKELRDKLKAKVQPKTATEYIKSKSSTSKKRIEQAETLAPLAQIMGDKVIQNIQEKVTQQEFEKLPEQEKHEIGYRYTDWGKVSPGEIKQYYGGGKYLKNVTPAQKEQLTQRYIKGGGLTREENIPSTIHQIRRTGIAPLVYSETGDSVQVVQKRKEMAWEQITKTPQQIKETYWQKLSPPMKWGSAFAYTTVQTATWPVTLPQQGIKLLTGKQVGPDIAGFFETHRPPAPRGALGIGFSVIDGINNTQRELEKAVQDPVSTVFATAGEYLGMRVGAQIVSVPFGAMKYGFKYGVRKTPEIFYKLRTYTTTQPQYKLISDNILYKHVGKLRMRTVGEQAYKLYETIPTRIFNKVNEIKYTSTWRNVQGWSTGDLVRAKTYPLATEQFLGGDRTGVTIRGDPTRTIFGHIETYEGWGRSEWIPKTMADLYQPGTRTSYNMLTNIVKKRKTATVRQFFDIEEVGLVKGHLWGKTITKKYGSIETVTGFGKSVVPKPEITFGMVKKTSPHPIMIATKTVQPKYLTFSDFLSDKYASATLVPPSTIYRTIPHVPMHGMAVTRFISVPTISTGMSLGYLGAISLGFRSVQNQQPFQYKVQIPTSITQRLPQSIRLPSSITDTITGQTYIPSYAQTSITRTDTTYKQIQRSISKTVSGSTTRGTGTYKTPTITTYKPPKIIIPLPPSSISIKKQIYRGVPRKDKYLFREFNIPRLDQIIKGFKI